MSSRSREGKKAFTFWIDTDLKQKVHEKAGMMNLTITDVITRAVEIYLAKGHELEDDEDFRKKLVAANISHGIRESGVNFEKINDSLESAMARIKVLEDKIIDPMPEIKKQVQLEINSKVSPVLERLSQLFTNLERQGI
ncbi:MAG: hypothetical protein INQ03_13195 [Candidatus Heimdallarchaeota archaeon]|nr:hypothetical protein [Candidatus Heimdallarchaeota archaeon]